MFFTHLLAYTHRQTYTQAYTLLISTAYLLQASGARECAMNLAVCMCHYASLCSCVCVCVKSRTCVCGSIMRGQRLALVTIIALSMENESFGRPAMPHARINTGSPRDAVREKVEELGMPLAADMDTHFLTTCKTQGTWYMHVRASAYGKRCGCTWTPTSSRPVKHGNTRTHAKTHEGTSAGMEHVCVCVCVWWGESVRTACLVSLVRRTGCVPDLCMPW